MRTLAIIGILTLVTLLSNRLVMAESLSIYHPDVRHTVVNHAYPDWSPGMGYNHDSDLVIFKGKYFCAWNANPGSCFEAKPGQFNFLSTSSDFRRWSTPIRPFHSENGAVNPVDADMQWQPNFINYNDKTLFCNWSQHSNHYVSHSTDGLHWTNTLIPGLPDGVEKVKAFPTQHGLLTKNGTMYFPISLSATGDFWSTHLCSCIRSTDGGKTWSWGGLVKSIPITKLGLDPAAFEGFQVFRLWEPIIFEHSDGRLGMLIRNLAKTGHPNKPEHTIVYAESRDQGTTWTDARPIEVDSVSTRILTASGATSPDSLFMVTNDWYVEVPMFVRDRHYLSLYMAPVTDPDLLLPGPIVQAPDSIAHYPNGHARDGKLFLSYSYGNVPRAIRASCVETLPDFTKPFLLPRGRDPQVKFDKHTAYFPQPASSLGLVLTKDLTYKPSIKLEFDAIVEQAERTGLGSDLPLLTLGGKTRNGTCLRLSGGENLQIKQNGQWTDLGKLQLRKWVHFTCEINRDSFTVSADGIETRTFNTRLLRKISFGGLYYIPTVYSSCATWRLKTDSIRIN